MNKKSAWLEERLQEGNIVEIYEVIHRTDDCLATGDLIEAILDEKDAPTEIIDYALARFAEMKNDENWMRVLTNFSHLLWVGRHDYWIHKFNSIVFPDMAGHFYATRLVFDFLQFSRMNDNPMKFGITAEALILTERACGRFTYEKRRIDAGIFGKES